MATAATYLNSHITDIRLASAFPIFHFPNPCFHYQYPFLDVRGISNVSSTIPGGSIHIFLTVCEVIMKSESVANWLTQHFSNSPQYIIYVYTWEKLKVLHEPTDKLFSTSVEDLAIRTGL